MQFGQRLLDELSRRGLNQRDLARLTGRSTSTVSRWITGEDTPSDANLRAISRALGLTEAEIGSWAGVELIGSGSGLRSAEDILAELEANSPVAVPIVQNVIAHMGNGGSVQDYWYLPPRMRRGRRKNYLGVIAEGDCMAPLICAGDYVIFDMDAPSSRRASARR